MRLFELYSKGLCCGILIPGELLNIVLSVFDVVLDTII